MSFKLLEAVGKLIPVPETNKKRVLELFQKVVVQKNTLWLKEGDRCRHIAFIEKGLLRFYVNQEGQHLTHYFASEGNFASNYESLLRKSASRKYIEAVETTTLWTISHSNLKKLYEEIPYGDRFGRLLAEKELLDTINRFLQQYTHGPEQRYQDFLSQYGNLQQRIPQYYIASYIGIQPQSLSRIRKRLSAGGRTITRSS